MDRGAWFLKCLCSVLPSPVWPLPIDLDSYPEHSRFLCNIALYSIGHSRFLCNIALYFLHQSHPQLGVVFALALSLHSGVISPLISSSISGTCQPGDFIFQCLIFLPFHTVHGVLKARILKWFVIPFSSGPCFVRTLHHDLPRWVALHGMAHSFIELDKAVVHVIRLVSFLWLWFSVCLLFDGEG